jgi:protein-tyrosine-phosphatase
MSKEKILVICRSNVGRSQMGEGLLKARTSNDPNISVSSAGLDTTGMVEKYNGHPHPQVIYVMKEIGIDISDQQITQVSPDLLEDSTRVVVLAEEHELPDYFQKYRDKTSFHAIEDPAPGNTDVVDLLRLRHIRDQIQTVLSQALK